MEEDRQSGESWKKLKKSERESEGQGETSDVKRKLPNKEEMKQIRSQLALVLQLVDYIKKNLSSFSDKRGYYALQLNMIVIGESVNQILQIIKVNNRDTPIIFNLVPWPVLIKLRNIGTHKAHKFDLQDLAHLAKAIKLDIFLLEKVTKAIIQAIDRNEEAAQQEPIELKNIQLFLADFEKAKKEEQKNTHDKQTAREIDALKLILNEIANMGEFLAVDDDVSIYAIQMCVLKIGLAVSDRLKEVQKEYPLNIKPGNQRYPITWKYLVTQRELVTHSNFGLNKEFTLDSAKNYSYITGFIRDISVKMESAYEASKVNIKEEKPVVPIEPVAPMPMQGAFQSFKFTQPPKQKAPIGRGTFLGSSKTNFNKPAEQNAPGSKESTTEDTANKSTIVPKKTNH